MKGKFNYFNINTSRNYTAFAHGSGFYLIYPVTFLSGHDVSKFAKYLFTSAHAHAISLCIDLLFGFKQSIQISEIKI